MQETMKYLCENVQGCVLGYTQSDEITLVLVDYQSEEASAWFDNNIQKMVSVSASMATMAFNRAFSNNVHLSRLADEVANDGTIMYFVDPYAKYVSKCGMAMFDSRVFTLPKEEVVNCLIWRQQDATRNSIQSVGQANFSHTQLHGKNCSDIQDMLMLEKGINWNDFPTHLKRGSCCIKETYFVEHENGKNVYFPDGDPIEGEMLRGTYRNRWVIDTEIPIFTQDKEYINQLIYI